MEREQDKRSLMIIDKIYTTFFKQMQQEIVNIFLCGGASSTKKFSVRDKIKKDMGRNGKFRILYPEDLFMDMLSQNNKHNLLGLEQVLANNCDCICIVCESVGSFVELGAFTNNSETFNKVIALVQTKFKNHKSFLMLGPIKYIQSKNKGNVIFYNSNLQNAEAKLIKTIKKYTDLKSEKGLNTIVGLHYFILLILYFFKRIEIKSILEYLKQIIADNQVSLSNSDFTLIFRPAMKLLYKEGAVGRNLINGRDCYELTSIGQNICKKILEENKSYNKYRMRDKLRLDVLKNVYY